MKISLSLTFLFSLLPLSISACGGGSGGSNGMLIEGTLTENGGAAHALQLVSRHSTGQRIAHVEVCALGECSTTDAQGQWGLIAPEGFDGGEVLFSINGHGIATQTIINIPHGANEVVLDLQHVNDGDIEASHITVDGETTHLEDAGHAHE